MGAEEQEVGEEYLSYSSFVISPRSNDFANAFTFLPDRAKGNINRKIVEYT